MPASEEQEWRSHRAVAISALGVGFVCWLAVYGMSYLVAALLSKHGATLTERDQPLFHIYCVAVFHAVIAVLMGLSWTWQEWSSFPEKRIFGFN